MERARESSSGVEELFGLLLPEVERLVRLHLRYQESLRDDLVQEVMVALMSVNLDSLEHPKAYLATVVRRVAMRLVSRQPKYELIEEEKEDVRDDFTVIQEEELLEKLSGLIEELSPKCRRLLDLCRFKMEKDKMVAEDLNLPVKNIPPHRYQCLKRLRNQLESDHPQLHENLKESLGVG